MNNASAESAILVSAREEDRTVTLPWSAKREEVLRNECTGWCDNDDTKDIIFSGRLGDKRWHVFLEDRTAMKNTSVETAILISLRVGRLVALPWSKESEKTLKDKCVLSYASEITKDYLFKGSREDGKDWSVLLVDWPGVLLDGV